MPEPDLDEVGRKIKEAKEFAREVRQPGAEPEPGETPPESAADEADEEATPS